MSETNEETKQEAGKIYNVGSVNNMYVENIIIQPPTPELQTPPETQALPSPAAKKKYITDEKKMRYVLDDYDDEDGE